MNPQRWEQAKDIFWASVEIPSQRRSDYLGRACGADETLRVTVERLLLHHDESTQFLERPAIDVAVAGADDGDLPGTFVPGDFIGGRFRIKRFISKGGMGEVYEAIDEAVGGVPVALKTIRASLASDERVLLHFRNEVQLARRITHPNVCRIHDLIQCDAGSGRIVTFISMELLEGETLLDRLRRDGPLTPSEALPYIHQMTDALQAAHDEGVVHRDFKCSNIMLCRSRSGAPRVVVTDFGLAAAAAIGGELRKPDHNIAGTLDYMAPEQLSGGAVTGAADIYALGIVIFEMLKGRHPFSPASGVDQALERAKKLPQPSHFRTANLPASYLKAVVHCLQPDPQRRPASARAVWEELTQIRRYLSRAAFGVLFLASVAFGSVLIRQEFPRLFQFQAPAEASVAVLPFLNETRDARLDYLCDGVPGEVIDALTRIPSLRVAARNSAFQFRQNGPLLPEIARQLNVGTVLTGSVSASGGRLRVAVQLVNAADGFQLWSNTFERAGDDLLRLQADLSRSIIDALRLRLSRVQEASLAETQTSNPAAYHQYLLGKQAAASRSDAALQESLAHYEKALELDPNFAPAHAALAHTWSILAGRAGFPIDQVLPRAETAAKRALELNPKLGDAHCVLASVRQRFYWDWDSAEQHFEAALESSPGLAVAHHYYAGFLSQMGRHDAALEHIRRARELDPLSLIVNTAYGAYLYNARRYDEAIDQYRFVLQLNPRFVNALLLLGQAQRQQGQLEASAATFQDALNIGGATSAATSGLACTLARMRNSDRARALLAELESRWPAEQFSPSQIANIYRDLGDKESCYRWLDIAYSHRDLDLLALKTDPAYDSLRQDPKFRLIVERLRLQ